MAEERERATRPEDITRLFVERANAKDAEGLAELYEADAVLAFPPGQMTMGREAIQAVYERMVAQDLTFQQEEPLPTLYRGGSGTYCHAGERRSRCPGPGRASSARRDVVADPRPARLPRVVTSRTRVSRRASFRSLSSRSLMAWRTPSARRRCMVTCPASPRSSPRGADSKPKTGEG
jgi:SnoaL-like domain